MLSRCWIRRITFQRPIKPQYCFCFAFKQQNFLSSLTVSKIQLFPLDPAACLEIFLLSQKPAGVLLCLANIFFFSTEFKGSGIKGPNLWNAMVFLEYVPHTCAINSQSFQIQAFIFRWLKSSLHSRTIAKMKNENSHWNSSYYLYCAQLCQLKSYCFRPVHVHTSENYLVKHFFCGENIGTACGKISALWETKAGNKVKHSSPSETRIM